MQGQQDRLVAFCLLVKSRLGLHRTSVLNASPELLIWPTLLLCCPIIVPLTGVFSLLSLCIVLQDKIRSALVCC